MIKAYHQVAGGGANVDLIIAEGFIYPAIERIPPEELGAICEEEMLGYEIKGASERTIRALERLVERETKRVMRSPRRAGWTRTAFECVDFLMGDLKRVFFSGEGWLDDFANGFVYDADWLIDSGAMVRGSDFIELYHGLVSDLVLRRGFHTVDHAERLIREAAQSKRLKDYLRKEEDAKAELRNASEAGRLHDVEIVFEGSVPVKRALEIWKDGQRLR